MMFLVFTARGECQSGCQRYTLSQYASRLALASGCIASTLKQLGIIFVNCLARLTICDNIDKSHEIYTQFRVPPKVFTCAIFSVLKVLISFNFFVSIRQ